MRKSSRLPLEQLQPFLLEPPPAATDQPPRCFDWQAVFGNDHPVEVEVGFGKGLFLLTSAQANPGVNYVGIEIVRKYQLFTATRVAKRGLANVRLVCGDARSVLRDHVPPGSLRTVHVYFPDPWWKKRHHKRRVFTDEFALQCGRALRTGGTLLLATDVPDYAAMVAEVMAGQTALRPLPPPEEHRPEHDFDYLTNFERKFRKQGKGIYRLAYEKIGDST